MCLGPPDLPVFRPSAGKSACGLAPSPAPQAEALPGWRAGCRNLQLKIYCPTPLTLSVVRGEKRGREGEREMNWGRNGGRGGEADGWWIRRRSVCAAPVVRTAVIRRRRVMDERGPPHTPPVALPKIRVLFLKRQTCKRSFFCTETSLECVPSATFVRR